MLVYGLPKSLVVLGHILFVVSGVCEARNILCREGACQLRGRVLSDSKLEPDLRTWQPAAAPATVQPLHETPGTTADVVNHAIEGPTYSNVPIEGLIHANPPPASPPLPTEGEGIRPATPAAPSPTNCLNSYSVSNSSGPTNCSKYSLSMGFILGGGGCLALLGLVVLGVACGSRQRRAATDPETPEALVKLEGPIIGFHISMPGSTAMTQMAWDEPKALFELKGDRFVSPESTVHSANEYNASWHGPAFSESGHLMAVGGAESGVALNLSELQSSRGRERGSGGGVEETAQGARWNREEEWRGVGERRGQTGRPSCSYWDVRKILIEI